MQPLILTPSAFSDAAAAGMVLEEAWRQHRQVGLGALEDRDDLRRALGLGDGLSPRGLQMGAAVVVGSGGSSGRRRWCVQPLSHLEASAKATGRWLQAQGVDPSSCLHLNALPLHHVSGLMPLVRCRQWGAQLRWLPPSLLRRPAQLAAALPLDDPHTKPVLLSLVPTLLRRFLADPIALDWLRRCRVIWVGGAPLEARDASVARRSGLPISPCYGATETAAMVCALTPEQFLAGTQGCGHPLHDVDLRLDPASSALEVHCQRLSPGWLKDGQLVPLPQPQPGWWRSGDGAKLTAGGLQILGRLDGAIHSGGETLFLEMLEARLTAEAEAAGLGLQKLMLLGVPDQVWGERLVALLQTVPGTSPADLIGGLQRLVVRWRPAERPRQWQHCPELAVNCQGKWERHYWRQWLQARELLSPAGPSQS